MLFQMWLLGRRRGKSATLKRWMGITRVIAYGTCVSLGLGALTLHSAYAKAQDDSLKMGRQLADVADLLQDVTSVRINNQPIYMASATTGEPVGKVLDRFVAHCNHDPALGDLKWRDLGDLKGKSILPPKQTEVSGLGVMRREDPAHHDGMVLCFTRDGAEQSHSSFMDGLRAFQQTGDIASVGNLRYVHVTASPKTGRTLVQTVWTQGSFNIRDVVHDAPGDAPGSDSATLPRPENSVRQFTAEAMGTPYAARIYHSNDAPEVALKAYDHEMDKEGWLVIDNPLRDQDAELGRWYAHEGVQAMISVKPDGSGSQIIVGQMGNADRTPTVKADP